LHIICISADVGGASLLILALLLVDYFVGGASLFNLLRHWSKRCVIDSSIRDSDHQSSLGRGSSHSAIGRSGPLLTRLWAPGV